MWNKEASILVVVPTTIFVKFVLFDYSKTTKVMGERNIFEYIDYSYISRGRSGTWNLLLSTFPVQVVFLFLFLLVPRNIKGMNLGSNSKYNMRIITNEEQKKRKSTQSERNKKWRSHWYKLGISNEIKKNRRQREWRWETRRHPRHERTCLRVIF